jgi:hypothetical protein
MDSFVRINGRTFDWGSTRIKLAGRLFVGLKSIKYGHKRNRAKVAGMGKARRAISWSQGRYETEDLVLSMYRRSAQDLREYIAELAGGTSYGDFQFTTSVQYIERGIRSVHDELRNCVILGDAGGGEENPDPEMEDVTIGFLELIRNKKRLGAEPR